MQQASSVSAGVAETETAYIRKRFELVLGSFQDSSGLIVCTSLRVTLRSSAYIEVSAYIDANPGERRVEYLLRLLATRLL
jgi:hypothetical protein